MVNWKRAGLAVGAVAGTGLGAYAISKLSSSDSSSSNKSSKKSKSKTTESGDDTGEDSASETSEEESGDEESKKTKSKVVEIPIDNYEDALAFANTEWNKIKRDNGHTLECQTIGSPNWRTGEWCKVYMPSFDIDDYMYITITSQSSEGGEWGTNLTLKDYPPGWGKEDLTENTDNEEEDEEDEENKDSTNTDGSSTDGNSNDESNSSSSG